MKYALIAATLMGCASAEKNGNTLQVRFKNHPKKPAPACHYEVKLDGEALHYGDIDVCPVVPACQEPL